VVARETPLLNRSVAANLAVMHAVIDARRVRSDRGRTLFGVLAAAFMTLLLQPAAAQSPSGVMAIDQPYASVEGWQVGLMRRFGGCVATTRYTDETTVWLGFTGDNNTAYIALTNPNWKSLQPNQPYRLEFRAAGGNNWNGEFRGFRQNDAENGLAQFGLRREFVLDLARARGIFVRFDGRQIAALSLRGSSAALESTLACQRQHAFSPDRRDAPSPGAEAANRPAPQRPRERGVSTGTGFFVSVDGHILTNNHVVENCTSITVNRPGADPRPAVLIARDETNDLALLRSDHRPAMVPSFNPSVRVGESIYVYGFPLTGLLTSTGNFTTGTLSALAGLRDDTRMVQHSAPTQPGNSGGPLLDRNGNVVGVIVSKLNVLAVARQTQGDIAQNVNFAIRSAVAQSFLQIHGIDRREVPSSKELPVPAVAEAARDFTLQVVCPRE